MISGVVDADRLQPLLQAAAKFIGAGAKVFFLDHVQHGIGRGDAERVAAIGAAQAAGMGRVHQLGLAGHGGQRQAAGQTLGHGGQVGGHAVALHREQGAGAGKAGLHLIGDHHDAMLVAQRADRRAPDRSAPGRSRLRPAPVRR